MSELGLASSKVTPIFEKSPMQQSRHDHHHEQVINIFEISSLDAHDNKTIGLPPPDGGGDEFSGERNPHDRWLPITESRNGGTLKSAFLLFCSGMGFQAFLLPVAFVSLGWYWGIVSLSVIFSWQLYSIWLLVHLHESTPPNGIRYSRFLHLSIVAFGEKLGKLLAIFPTLYLSTGTCIMYIITGGTTIELLFQIMCGSSVECKAKTLTGAQWFLVFVSLAIFTAQFFPNLNSLSSVSFIGSITLLVYCFLLWFLSVGKGRAHDQLETVKSDGDHASQIRNVFNSIEFIALAFRGHNLVLEIQGTIPTSRKHPSRKSMWRGVIFSYLLIAFCMYPLSIVGYWAYGNKVPLNGGILNAFTKSHQQTTSKYLIGAIYILIIINYLCTFQIYAMVSFDNFERVYVMKNNKPCPRWLRSAIKVLFGGFTYFISVAIPFLPSLSGFIGSIALPLTFAYPCLMWVAIKKPGRFSVMRWFNWGLGFSGLVLSVAYGSVALWALIVNGVDANFFRPR